MEPIETSNIAREEAAASAKSTFSVACQICVAKVLKPMGANSIVAGSSLMAVRKTKTAPLITPGLTRGKVTSLRACQGFLPKLRADSSSWGLTCKRLVRIAPTDWGRNKTKYANTNIGNV